jgi:tetratricopeptide (TPR) repeat protein
MHELGTQYNSMGAADRAVVIYSRIADINPSDMEAIKKSKDAAANATMKQGGWETAKDYRDLIRNKDQAVALEQQGRVVKDVNMLDATLAEMAQKYEENPESMDVVRRIAGLYEQKASVTETIEDLDQAIQWYGYAHNLAGGADPAIARRLSDLQMKRLDFDINSLEDFFAKGGDQHEEAAQYRDQLDTLKRERAERLIAESKKRVERNPTDLQLRFELGERLLEAGNFGDAITELQKAQQNPNVRLRAMSLLGRCFVQKGMYDMAAARFEAAVSEMMAMDSTKKDTLYELAMLYERMGQKDKYVKCVKDIAEVDYTYKDIAQRMERLYTGGDAA